MAGKDACFGREFKENAPDALGHLFDIRTDHIGPADCFKEKRISGKEHLPFLTVETDASLAVAGRVKNHEIGIEERVSILQEEGWLWQFRVQ